MRIVAWIAIAVLSTAAKGQTIRTSDVAKHIGERGTVCGKVAGEHTATSSRGTPTFVNLDVPYPKQVFTVLIWGEDRTRVGAIPSSGMLCVTGVISSYRGSPEIVIKDAKSWYVPK
jgi:hypothetical protein